MKASTGFLRSLIRFFTAGFVFAVLVPKAWAIEADFDASPREAYPPQMVHFNDRSTGPIDTWIWSFPGGSPASATGPGPHAIYYSVPGIYDVSLTVIYDPGPQSPVERDTETKTEYIIMREPDRDYGDAPDSEESPRYPTLLGHDGAYHVGSDAIYLGSSVDLERDALPNGQASGDDDDNEDDEDGIHISPLHQGEQAHITVFAHGDGYLSAWFDWNQNYSWDDPGEKIVSAQFLTDGTHTIDFMVPVDAIEVYSCARFRYNSESRELAPDDYGDYGEVEDYKYIASPEEIPLDYGDVPDSPDGMIYPTLSEHNGAYHAMNTFYKMGHVIDADPDGQPNEHAVGDDGDGSDDEDGVSFPDPISLGGSINSEVEVSASGYLSAWVDWNADNDWDDTGEKIIDRQSLETGVTNIIKPVPDIATIGSKFARYRYCTENTLLGPTGFGSFGEVEDHIIFVEDSLRFDFGDAPDPAYPTYMESGGAYHTVSDEIYLGSSVDGEVHAYASPQANGDDNHGDDEDGLVFLTPFIQGLPATIQVTVHGLGMLYGWIDFNGDGDWLDSDLYENVVRGDGYTTGTYTFVVTVPPEAVPGATAARFRYDSEVGPAHWGPAAKSVAGHDNRRRLNDIHFAGRGNDGEVEDYVITIEANPELYDYGDAPDPDYPTLDASTGARHPVVRGVHLGSRVDIDMDGQPDPTATGDDSDGMDDDDGVVFTTVLSAGNPAACDVYASFDGVMHAWIDFDRDGDWDQPSERIYAGSVSNGHNPITFTVPATASAGQTFARFRYTTGSMPSWQNQPDGDWPDGEVEDYLVDIYDESIIMDFDYGDAVNVSGQWYPVVAGDGGARHRIGMVMLWLGSGVDAELDGLPNPQALGDDLVGSDDEDGVHHQPLYFPGMTNHVLVNACASGVLNGWMDFNQNGSWNQPGEHVITDVTVSAGVQVIPVDIPADATGGITFARYRLCTYAGLDYVGDAENGEVEDYRIRIWEEEVYGEAELDYGDAPDDTTAGFYYTTRLQDDGPRHLVSTRVFMGDTIDADTHGQPGPGADKDDITDESDEDGVIVPILTPGETDTICLKTQIGWGDSAWFHAWIDWNRDGDWRDALEHVYEYYKLPRGIWKLPVAVPTDAVIGPTFARFRWSTDTTIYYSGGFAWDGEVEDYKVWVDTVAFTGVEQIQVDVLPETFSLKQNYPNPFNPETIIEYDLSEQANVCLSIFDTRGREVTRLVQELQTAGSYRTRWQGRDWQGRPVSAGIYIYRIVIQSGRQRRMISRKMILVK